MEHYAKFDVHAAQQHVAPAVLGFFRSVALGQASGTRHSAALRLPFNLRQLPFGAKGIPVPFVALLLCRAAFWLHWYCLAAVLFPVPVLFHVLACNVKSVS